MSRAWIAFYIGDYLRDTGHLTTEQHGAYCLLLMHCWEKGSIPLGDEQRAALARLPLVRWNKMKDVVGAFFGPDGTQKRATKEIAKAETVSIKRAIAGRRGGVRSGAARTIAAKQRPKQMPTKNEANASDLLKQTPKQNLSICEAKHIREITTTFSEAARASPEGESGGEPEGLSNEERGAMASPSLEAAVRAKGWK